VTARAFQAKTLLFLFLLPLLTQLNFVVPCKNFFEGKGSSDAQLSRKRCLCTHGNHYAKTHGLWTRVEEKSELH
jgi:hypothetical protein